MRHKHSIQVLLHKCLSLKPTFNTAELNQLLDHHSSIKHSCISNQIAYTGMLYACLLDPKHCFINLFLCFGELAINRESGGDICVIAINLSPHITKYSISIF
jgi:hypothetical protein